MPGGSAITTLTQKRAVFPAFSSREVTIGQMRKIGIHFIIHPGIGFAKPTASRDIILSSTKQLDAAQVSLSVTSGFGESLEEKIRQKEAESHFLAENLEEAIKQQTELDATLTTLNREASIVFSNIFMQKTLILIPKWDKAYKMCFKCF